MEISLKSFTLFGAILLTGLSAGLFYAWSVSVIPGTQRLSDTTYLETMQSINRAILNPAFFTVFFGCTCLLGASVIFQFSDQKLSFWFVLGAFTAYLLGTIGVTGLGNVPLNNELDALNLSRMGQEKLAEFRAYYESNWNRLHTIRTTFAVCSFVLAVLSIFTMTKS